MDLRIGNPGKKRIVFRWRVSPGPRVSGTWWGRYWNWGGEAEEVGENQVALILETVGTAVVGLIGPSA